MAKVITSKSKSAAKKSAVVAPARRTKFAPNIPPVQRVTETETVKRSPGRPEKFGAGHTRAFKSIVKRFGLIKGHEYINEHGVTVGGKLREVSISIPTLSKYVKRSDIGGAAVELKHGGSRKAA